jgi:hypothetical protein
MMSETNVRDPRTISLCHHGANMVATQRILKVSVPRVFAAYELFGIGEEANVFRGYHSLSTTNSSIFIR